MISLINCKIDMLENFSNRVDSHLASVCSPDQFLQCEANKRLAACMLHILSSLMLTFSQDFCQYYLSSPFTTLNLLHLGRKLTDVKFWMRFQHHCKMIATTPTESFNYLLAVRSLLHVWLYRQRNQLGAMYQMNKKQQAY